MEAIPNHVESRAKIQLEKWKQIMDDCQELAYLTNIANCAPWPLLSGGLLKISKPSILLGKHIWEWTNYPYGPIGNHLENKALGGEPVQAACKSIMAKIN
jgi:hypothetical protein